MNEPSVSDLARMAEATYHQNSTASKGERFKKQNNAVKDLGYSVEEPHTNKHISTFRNGDTYVIAHKGTDLHSKKKNVFQDLKNDFNILIGKDGNSSMTKKRTNKTKKIMKQIKKDNPNAQIHLTGHSLGSMTAYGATQDKYITKNINSLNTFNGGASPLFNSSISHDKETKKRVKKIATHHHIEGDSISSGIKGNWVGKFKKYKSDKKPSHTKRVLSALSPVFNTLGKAKQTLESHSLKNFY